MYTMNSQNIREFGVQVVVTEEIHKMNKTPAKIVDLNGRFVILYSAYLKLSSTARMIASDWTVHLHWIIPE